MINREREREKEMRDEEEDDQGVRLKCKISKRKSKGRDTGKNILSTLSSGISKRGSSSSRSGRIGGAPPGCGHGHAW